MDEKNATMVKDPSQPRYCKTICIMNAPNSETSA